LQNRRLKLLLNTVLVIFMKIFAKKEIFVAQKNVVTFAKINTFTQFFLALRAAEAAPVFIHSQNHLNLYLEPFKGTVSRDFRSSVFFQTSVQCPD
jgi:hypothetical protein